MEKRTSKTGRVIVILNGYDEGYRAYILGAITGVVSLPSKYNDMDNDDLNQIAHDCLCDRNAGTENCKYYNAKIIKKAGKIF